MIDAKLSRLRRKPDYYLNDAPEWVRVVWNRQESFDWFVKNHRSQLLEMGALLRLGRDQFIDIEVFPSAAKAILGLAEQDEQQELAEEVA